MYNMLISIKPEYVDGQVAFVIDAEDDENITTVEITHNGEAKQSENVGNTTYHKIVEMTEGETNTLIVTVTNINGLQKTLSRQHKTFVRSKAIC